jgi:hypothetical protein
VVRCIAVAAALLCACGAEFIEPNPPRLSRVRIDHSASSAAEPAVWLVIADLFLEHDEDCAAAMAWLSASIHAAVPAQAPGALEVARLQVSPCTQPNTRSIDLSAIDAALRAGEAAFPGHAVRAVLLYANNVLLPVPPSIARALDTARQQAVARGALEPRVWALLTASGAGTVRADRTLLWTYAGDAALTRQIAQIGADELPFTSDADVVTPALPLFGGGPPGVRMFKVCEVDEGVETLGFARDGSPIPVDPAQPPRYRVTLPARLAMPRAQFQPLRAGLEVEACLDHCDRYYCDDPVRWLAQQGCLSPGGPS